MAVPIPGKGKPTNRVQGHSAEQGLRLEYAGKKPVEEVLATPPGRYEASKAHCGGDNRLYHGDNLGVLAALAQDESVAGKVRLVYIDPPFSTAAASFSRASE
jgi:adenine-specific DNA-methyltransferase